MSARNPRRVSSPCSLLASLASTQRYSHSLSFSLSHTHTHTHLAGSLSAVHTQTRYPSLPILLTFLSTLTQHLFPLEVTGLLSLSRWVTDSDVFDGLETRVQFQGSSGTLCPPFFLVLVHFKASHVTYKTLLKNPCCNLTTCKLTYHLHLY